MLPDRPGRAENNWLIITNTEYMCRFDDQKPTEIHFHVSDSHLRRRLESTVGINAPLHALFLPLLLCNGVFDLYSRTAQQVKERPLCDHPARSFKQLSGQKKKQKNTCFAKLFRLHSSSLSPWLCHDVNPLTVKMHDDTINPLPAINLQEEAATVTDANLFITDNNALQTALIKAYQKHSKCGGCMSCRLLTGTVCASMLG